MMTVICQTYGNIKHGCITFIIYQNNKEEKTIEPTSVCLYVEYPFVGIDELHVSINIERKYKSAVRANNFKF